MSVPSLQRTKIPCCKVVVPIKVTLYKSCTTLVLGGYPLRSPWRYLLIKTKITFVGCTEVTIFGILFWSTFLDKLINYISARKIHTMKLLNLLFSKRPSDNCVTWLKRDSLESQKVAWFLDDTRIRNLWKGQNNLKYAWLFCSCYF